MATRIRPLAGKPTPASMLIDVAKLVAAYHADVPDPTVAAERVAFGYLFAHRPQWGRQAAVGKTVVSTRLIDRLTARLGRKLYEVPVGMST